MMKTKIGFISDLHLFNKTANIKKALSKMHKKKEDTYMGNIVDGDDLEEDKRDAFAEAMQSLIEFILQ